MGLKNNWKKCLVFNLEKIPGTRLTSRKYADSSTNKKYNTFHSCRVRKIKSLDLAKLWWFTIMFIFCTLIYFNIVSKTKVSDVRRELSKEYIPSWFVAARIIPAKRKAKKKQKIRLNTIYKGLDKKQFGVHAVLGGQI